MGRLRSEVPLEVELGRLPYAGLSRGGDGWEVTFELGTFAIRSGGSTVLTASPGSLDQAVTRRFGSGVSLSSFGPGDALMVLARLDTIVHALTAESDDASGAWLAAHQLVMAAEERVDWTGHELSALIARNRFVFYSWPFRSDQVERYARVHTPDAEHEMDGLLREAQAVWLDLLARYRSWSPRYEIDGPWVEQEARLTVESVLANGQMDASSRLRTLERVQHAIALPRFDLRLADRTSSSSASWLLRILPLTLWTVGAIAALAAVATGRATVLVDPSPGLLVLALAGYVAAIAVAVTVGPLVAGPWCLRLPASTAIGVAGLLSVGSIAEWHASGWAIVLTASLSLGYLLLEATNQGLASGTVVLRRAFAVWLLGLAHATCVTLIGLLVIDPVIHPAATAHGASGAGHVAGITTGALAPGSELSQVAFVACASLAFGLLLQVLWDDSAVTAPLSQTDWS